MGDCRTEWGNYVTQAFKSARRAAVVMLFAFLAMSVQASKSHAQSVDDGFIAPAIITDLTDGKGSRRDPQAQAIDADAQVRPHWCNTTSALVDDIHRLGGYSVMRADIGEGRTLERYWNAKEEVVIEHGSDGTSCLVDLRSRR